MPERFHTALLRPDRPTDTEDSVTFRTGQPGAPTATEVSAGWSVSRARPEP